jgi:NADH:ubiquinone oxidoreductase subunit F (NADH-binding)
MNEYLMRHDEVGAHLHYLMCKALGIETAEKWYTLKPVCEHEDVMVLWNQEVHTDREVMANRPHIIIKTENSILTDVAIPVDRNYIENKAEKKLKYKRLCI